MKKKKFLIEIQGKKKEQMVREKKKIK